MAISVINNLSMNRSDTAVADDVWTATSATASDFQAPAAGGSMVLIKTLTSLIAPTSTICLCLEIMLAQLLIEKWLLRYR